MKRYELSSRCVNWNKLTLFTESEPHYVRRDGTLEEEFEKYGNIVVSIDGFEGLYMEEDDELRQFPRMNTEEVRAYILLHEVPKDGEDLSEIIMRLTAQEDPTLPEYFHSVSYI